MARERLRQVNIWLNEEQYKSLRQEAEKKRVSVYAYTKQLILNRRIAPEINMLLLLTYACSEAIWLFLCWQLLTKFLSILPSL